MDNKRVKYFNSDMFAINYHASYANAAQGCPNDPLSSWHYTIVGVNMGIYCFLPAALPYRTTYS